MTIEKNVVRQAKVLTEGCRLALGASRRPSVS